MCAGTFKLQPSLDCSIEEELGVFNVQEILSGWHSAPVPGARIVAPLDTSKVLGKLPVYSFLNHPVCPKALRRATDHAGDGVAASDPAITAGLIALNQAPLLHGGQGLPLLNEVTQGDVHRPISLQFTSDKVFFPSVSI